MPPLDASAPGIHLAPAPFPSHRHGTAKKLVSEDEPASGMGAGVLQSGVHPPRRAPDRLSLPVP